MYGRRDGLAATKEACGRSYENYIGRKKELKNIKDLYLTGIEN